VDSTFTDPADNRMATSEAATPRALAITSLSVAMKRASRLAILTRSA